MTARRLRALALAELLGFLGFLGLMFASIALYPGGTFMDRATHGHRFFANFVCDVQQPVALDGVPNPVGSLLGQLAMFVLFATWIPYWAIAARVLPRGGRWVRRLGVAASIVACAIPLLPSERFGRLHAVAIFAAAFPGLGALLISIGEILLARGLSRPLRFSSGLLAVTAFGDAALYAWHTITESEVTIALPALQKIAALALFLWMSLVTQTALSSLGSLTRVPVEINTERDGSPTPR